MLENTEGAIKKGQSRENMAHTTKKNIIQYVLDTTTQKHTNNVIMACALLQTTGDKNERNTVFLRKYEL